MHRGPGDYSASTIFDKHYCENAKSGVMRGRRTRIGWVPRWGWGKYATEMRCIPSLVAATSFTLTAALAVGGEDNPFGLGKGSLLICGGGKLPPAVMDAFFRAGGGENGVLVVIPSASPRSDHGDYTPWPDLWSKYAWRKMTVLHLESRTQADEEKTVALLESATAIWIGGGDQSRLSDRMVGTAMEGALQQFLSRGGLLGGTSAGAAICSPLMIADGETEPRFRTGLPILQGVIVDQHFTAKNRMQRLAQAVVRHPGHCGVGLDESTGLMISEKGIQVLGDGHVHFYRPDRAEELEFRADELWSHGAEHPLDVLRAPASDPADR